MPNISIIIRTKNEEEWFGHCLESIFNQDYKDFEIILVDNKSSDNTLNIANRYKLKKIINVNEFLPGKAINLGINVSLGKFIVCVSAHCIPKNKNWLSQLLSNFEDENVAGVYGRQLPVSFTDPVDKRDLINTFGLDRKVQVKDYFFHNANSMIRKSVWKKIPFDENVTNIEDRVWGKKIIDEGYNIIYDPEAAVYHYHGLHQGNPEKRVKGVVSIINSLDENTMNQLPDSLKPENIKIAAIIPIPNNFSENKLALKLLEKLINDLHQIKYIKKIYLLDNNSSLSQQFNVEYINRVDQIDPEISSLENAIEYSLRIIEQSGFYPEKLMYLNYDYVYRTKDLLNDLIVKAQYGGYDSIFPAFEDYGNLWIKNDKLDFDPINRSLTSRDKRDPIYRALYGLGCVTSVAIVRKKKLIGNKVGIIPLSNIKFTIRLKEQGASEIVSSLLNI